MYCILRNNCKYSYKCCAYCKQNCDDRCHDEAEGCKFFCKNEPDVCYNFNNKLNNSSDKVCNKETKKVVINTPTKNSPVQTQKSAVKVKKKLI